MRFSRGAGSVIAVLLLPAVALAGVAAYPRVRWMGEIPSRLEIAAETAWAALSGAGRRRVGPGSRPGAVLARPVAYSPVAGADAGPGEMYIEGLPDVAALLEEAVAREEAWLLACRTAQGTFAVAPGSDLIVPYFANQAARALLPGHAAEVRAHLEWYLAHLNRPDRWGLSGTVYDYRLDGEREVPTGSYDSADAYAATFLSAVARYWQSTGDTAFVLENRADLDLVAGVIVALQDADGLAWARPGHWVKYLMDNAENFQGLADYAWLLGELGDEAAARYWAERAEAVRNGIRLVMYDPRRGDYCWAVKRSGTRRLPNWRQWYPDAVAQLFPVLCGVEDPAGAVARSVYGRFVRFHPGWVSLPRASRSPWGVIVPVAVAMGDTVGLEAGLAGPPGASTPAPWWHAGEAAQLVQAARLWLSHLASAGGAALGVAGGAGGTGETGGAAGP